MQNAAACAGDHLNSQKAVAQVVRITSFILAAIDSDCGLACRMRPSLADASALSWQLQPPLDDLDKLPVWWCIACPVVAGLAVPLAINVLTYLLAVFICRILHLKQDSQALVLCALRHAGPGPSPLADVRGGAHATFRAPEALCCSREGDSTMLRSS